MTAAPVVNTSAFEFGQRAAFWDGDDLNRQGRGNRWGTITERLAHTYFEQIVLQANALTDIHSGGPDRNCYYTINLSDIPGVEVDSVTVRTSRDMALAFGPEHIFARTPWRGTLQDEVMKAGIPSITIEMGGGADFFRHGDEQIATCVRGVTNVVKLLGMLDGGTQVEAST